MENCNVTVLWFCYSFIPKIKDFIKLKILKWLSNPNSSWQLLETRDSDRCLSKYLNDPKKIDFIIPIFGKTKNC